MEVAGTSDWTDAFPDVRQGAVPQTAGVNAPTDTMTPQPPGSAFPANLPDVRATATNTQQPPPFPVTGPTGNFWTDLTNRLNTAGATAAVGTTAPFANVRVPQYGPQGLVMPSQQPTATNTPQSMMGNALQAFGTPYYQPQSWLGRRTQDALTGAVQSLSDPAAFPATIAGSITSGAAQEAMPNVNPAITGLLGFLPGAKLGSTIANRFIPPGGGGATPSMTPETAGLVKQAQDLNIPIGLGQATSNPFIRYFYSETGKLPFSGAEMFTGTQQNAVNRAVSNTFGENADKITPDVLTNAYTRIGNGFDTVAQRTPFPMSNGLMDKLQTTVDSTLAGSRPNVEDAQTKILQAATDNNGTITGDVYQRLTQRNGLVDRMINSNDPEVRTAGLSFRSALDDELQANAAPSDVTALQTLRAQYKALKTVQPLTLRADTLGGARPTEGDISPAALRGAVNNNYDQTQLAKAKPGDIPLNDIADIGQRFLKEPADSGTPSRLLTQHTMGTLGTIGGMLVAGHEAGLGPFQTLAASLGPVVAARLAQSALRNPGIVNRAAARTLNPQGFQFPTLPTNPLSAAAATGPMPFGFVPLSISPPQQGQQ